MKQESMPHGYLPEEHHYPEKLFELPKSKRSLSTEVKLRRMAKFVTLQSMNGTLGFTENRMINLSTALNRRKYNDDLSRAVVTAFDERNKDRKGLITPTDVKLEAQRIGVFDLIWEEDPLVDDLPPAHETYESELAENCVID